MKITQETIKDPNKTLYELEVGGGEDVIDNIALFMAKKGNHNIRTSGIKEEIMDKVYKKIAKEKPKSFILFKEIKIQDIQDAVALRVIGV